MDEKYQYAIMVEGKQTPSVLYAGYENALEQAKKLAIKEGKTTWILKTVTKLELDNVKVTQL